MARTKQTARKIVGGKSPRKSHASGVNARKSTIQDLNDMPSNDGENQIYVIYKGKELTVQKYINIITKQSTKDVTLKKDEVDVKYTNAEDFMGGLVEATEADDYELYKKLVETNSGLVDKLDYHFWPETFALGPEKEIEVWVNYSEKSQRILDLSLIPIKYEKLFDIGLQQPNINMDDIDDAVDDLEEKLDNEEDKFISFIIKNRIAKIKKRNDTLNQWLVNIKKLSNNFDFSKQSFIISKGQYDDSRWDEPSKILLSNLTDMLVKTNVLKNMKLWSQDDGVARFILSKNPKTNEEALDLLHEQFKKYIIKECQLKSDKDNNGRVISTHIMYALENNNLLHFIYPDIELREDRRDKLWNMFHKITLVKDF